MFAPFVIKVLEFCVILNIECEIFNYFGSYDNFCSIQMCIGELALMCSLRLL